jgi:hypothetical protein
MREYRYLLLTEKDLTFTSQGRVLVRTLKSGHEIYLSNHIIRDVFSRYSDKSGYEKEDELKKLKDTLSLFAFPIIDWVTKNPKEKTVDNQYIFISNVKKLSLVTYADKEEVTFITILPYGIDYTRSGKTKKVVVLEGKEYKVVELD